MLSLANWVSGTHANVGTFAGLEQEVSVLDPTKLCLLDAPGSAVNAFDLRGVFAAADSQMHPCALFLSAKITTPGGSSFIQELESENQRLARRAIREQGIKQRFVPLFAYVFTAALEGIEEGLAKLAAAGEEEIMVVSGDSLPVFLPILKARTSLVAQSLAPPLGERQLT